MDNEGQKRKQYRRNKAYFETHKEDEAARLATYYAENRETVLNQQAEYREQNRDKRNAYFRDRRARLKTGKPLRGKKPTYYCEKCNALMHRADRARYPLEDGSQKVLCRTCNNDYTFASDGSIVKRNR